MAILATTIGLAATGVVTVNTTYTDTYSAFGSEVRIVALDLTEGTFYEIDGDGTAGDAYIRVFDAFGNEVRAQDDAVDAGEFVGLDFYAQFIPNYTGRYYFAVSSIEITEYDPFTIIGRTNPGNFVTTATGSLVVTQSFTTSAIFPDANVGSTITATSGDDESDLVSVAGQSLRLHYSDASTVFGTTDIEIARFDLQKGDRVVIDLNGNIAADILDTQLRVFDAAGTALASDADSGFLGDSELTFVASSAGVYYIGVSGAGNGSYDVLTGNGTLVGDTGQFRAILHLNPDLIGGSVADILTGDDEANYIVGRAGNDNLVGNDGNDTLAGGDDIDRLTGGNGRDVLYGEFGNDVLNGSKGSDVLTGGEGDDDLTGSEGTDLLAGDEGNDTISGGKGSDTARGGDDNDDITGAEGSDSLIGDAGNDTLDGGTGSDVLFGGIGDDELDGEDNADSMFGEAGLDTLDGGLGNDFLDGGDGIDRVEGGDDNDEVRGGIGDDSVIGGLGADTLVGGLGNDRASGGIEVGVRDVFRFGATNEGVDTITDFELGTDVIDLSTIFFVAGSNVNAGNLSSFVQTTPSGGGSNSFLGIDANGVTGGLSFIIIAEVNSVTPAQLFDIDNFLV